MAKSKKLQNEIGWNLKLVDEGISAFQILEQRLENANSVQMKEKYQNDMKKEIKKLQRLRDFFRQSINSTEVKDKTKLLEAKKRIEDQMATYRDLEKEYKLKKLNKADYQNANEVAGKFNFGSGSEDEDNSDVGNTSSDEEDRGVSCIEVPAKGNVQARSRAQSKISSVDSDTEFGENIEPVNRVQSGFTLTKHFAEDEELDSGLDLSLPVTDKEQLIATFLGELREIQNKHEGEINGLRNLRKANGKKNKERITALMNRMAECKAVRERIEELHIGLDYLDSRSMRRVQHFGLLYLKQIEDEELRQSFLSEIERLIELSESNRFNSSSGGAQNAQNAGGGNSASDEQRPPSQISDIAMQFPEAVLDNGQSISVENLLVGNILDAQDYLGAWHQAIVIDEKGMNCKQIHFLPFNKANRDEEFTSDDNSRISPIFTMTKNNAADGTMKKTFDTLKQYMDQYRAKLGKKTEEFKSAITQAQQQKINQNAAAQSMNNTALKNQKQVKKTKGPSGGKLSLNASVDASQTQTKNELHEEQANQQAHKMATLVGSKAGKSSAESKLPDDQNAVPQSTTPLAQQTMFQGNPFTFKGLQKPASMMGSQLSKGVADSHGPPQQNIENNIGTSSLSGGLLPNQIGGARAQLITQDAPNQPSLPDFSAQLPKFKGLSSMALNSSDESKIGLASQLLTNQQVKPQISKSRQVLEMLETSLQNAPQPWDQEVIDPKQPAPVQLGTHEFPTVPMFARKENFAMFDLETLFFVFYHQQGTQQQYLAALELKKKNWQFNKKFETWFRKADGATEQYAAGTAARGSSKDNARDRSDASGREQGKYVFFDFENKWEQRVTSDDQIEIEAAQIENELVVQGPPHSHFGYGQPMPLQPGQTTSSLGLGGGNAVTGQQLATGGVPQPSMGPAVGNLGSTASARVSQQQIQ